MGEPPHPPPPKKTKTKQDHPARTVPKSNRKKPVERDKIDTPNTHDCTLAWQ